MEYGRPAAAGAIIGDGRRRKRSATSPPAGRQPQTSKKQRGRPRVEPQDETPADRRRTQIRLAQRTYRARKETTINFLEGKVAHLENVIHTHDANLRQLYQLALEANVAQHSPQFIQTLSNAANELAAAIDHLNTAFQPFDDANLTTNSALPACRGSTHLQDYKHPTPPPSEESSVDEASSSFPSTITGTRHSRSVHMPFMSSAVPLDQATAMSSSPHSKNILQDTRQHRKQSTLASNFTAAPSQHYHQAQGIPFSAGPVQCLQNTMPLELPLPQTFSFHEGTFSRFFHRSCLEHASRLIHRTDARPEDLNRVFSSPLRYSTLSDIAQRLQIRLHSSVHEDLDSPYPYPKGNLQDDPETLQCGPWFGPNDLERYLGSKGLKINPAAQIMICESDEILNDSPAVPMLGWLAQSSSAALEQDFYNGSDAAKQNSEFGISWTFDNKANTNFQSRGSRKRLRLDVQKLLGHLIDASRCRGPYPAVLRKDVNQAFKTSIISIEELPS